MEKQNENEAEIKKKIKIEKNNKIMQKKKETLFIWRWRNECKQSYITKGMNAQ